MKTYFVITDTKNSNDSTMYVGEGNSNGLTPHLDMATRFDTEEEAEEAAEELGEWAGVEEEEFLFTLEDTHLYKLPSGHGHWKITGKSGDFSHTIVTNDSQLIDDAFNSEEGDTSYYDSVEEAREAIIERLNQ